MALRPSSDILDKSWLFEIFDTRTQLVEASFTLILPPQSLVIREPQRINIQKTFENVFVDDYGPDNLEITIEAISGTTTVFPTFNTQGSGMLSSMSITQLPSPIQNVLPSSAMPGTLVNPTTSGTTSFQGYNQRQAFYTFRDTIMRYKDAGDYEYKELRVYDLFDTQAYKCILQDFALKRTNQTPIWYPFEIKLFVYARFDNKAAFKPTPLPFASGNPSALLTTITNALSWIQVAINFSTTVKTAVGNALRMASLISARLTSTAQALVGTAATPLQLSQQLVGFCLTVNSQIYGVYASGKLVASEYAHCLEVGHSAVSSALSLWGYTLQQGAAPVSATQSINYDNGLSLNTTDYTGNSNDRVASPQSFTYSGYKPYSVGGGDTLQRIALTQMGNDTLWPYIAIVNNITDDSELPANDTIYIPVPLSSTAVTDPYIYPQLQNSSTLGTDIALDDNGDLLLGGNDLVSTSGLNNLLQAINVRLQNEQGQLIKQSAFGILSQVGNAGASLANSYLQMAVAASLVEDPRIVEANNVNTMITGDTIYIVASLKVAGLPNVIPLATQV